ncbi:MAG: bacteriohemerythrin [Clostridiales bacterium]
MPYITWTSNYNIGISEIDAQHKRLIEIIDEIYESVNSGKEKEVTHRIINELIDYYITHFSVEERIMSEHGYVSYISHTKEHNDFKIVIEGYRKEIESGQLVVSMEMVKYLKEWFIKHILVSDKLIGVFLKRKGIKILEE